MAARPAVEPSGQCHLVGLDGVPPDVARARPSRRGGRRHRARWATPPPRGRVVPSRSPRPARPGRPPRRRPGTGRRSRTGPGVRRGRRTRTGRRACDRDRARKSAAAGSGRWGASWAASTTTGTPRSWAAAMIGVDGREPARHVGCAGDGQERRPPGAGVERGHHVVDVEGAVGPALDVAAPGHPTPREEVGVVLDDGGDDHVVRCEAEPVGEVVDGLGGVAAQDGDVVAVRVPAGEGQDGPAGFLVGDGGPS